MNMQQGPNETKEEYLKRLFAEGDIAITNMNSITEDMKRIGVIGFCNKCGCDRYADRKHNC